MWWACEMSLWWFFFSSERIGIKVPSRLTVEGKRKHHRERKARQRMSRCTVSISPFRGKDCTRNRNVTNGSITVAYSTEHCWVTFLAMCEMHHPGVSSIAPNQSVRQPVPNPCFVLLMRMHGRIPCLFGMLNRISSWNLEIWHLHVWFFASRMFVETESLLLFWASCQQISDHAVCFQRIVQHFPSLVLGTHVLSQVFSNFCGRWRCSHTKGLFLLTQRKFWPFLAFLLGRNDQIPNRKWLEPRPTKSAARVSMEKVRRHNHEMCPSRSNRKNEAPLVRRNRIVGCDELLLLVLSTKSPSQLLVLSISRRLWKS